MARKRIEQKPKSLTPEQLDSLWSEGNTPRVGQDIAHFKRFGLLLRQLRLARGFSIRYVSEKTLISTSYMYQIERGERNLPREPILLLLSELYEVPFVPLVLTADRMHEEEESLYHNQLNQAFHYVCQDKRFQFNSLVNEKIAKDDVKRFVIEMYQHFTGLKLIEGNEENRINPVWLKNMRPLKPVGSKPKPDLSNTTELG